MTDTGKWKNDNTASQAYEKLVAELEKVRQSFFRWSLLADILGILAAASILFIICLLLDSFFDFSFDSARRILLLFVLTVFLFSSFVFFRRFSRIPDLLETARLSEKTGQYGDLLITAVELENNLKNQNIGSEKNPGFSKAMIRRVIREAARLVEKHQPEERSTQELLGSRLKFLGMVLFLLFVLLFLPPVTTSFSKYYLAANIMLGRTMTDFLVTPGSTECFRGESITVRVERSPFNMMTVETTDLTGGNTATFEMKKTGQGIFECTLGPLERSLTYRVASSFIRSPEFTIRVSSRPELESLRVEYVFPPYTGIQPIVEDSATDINVLYGTKIKMSARSTKPLRAASIHFRSGETFPMQVVSEDIASYEFVARENSSYRIELEDREGHRNKAPETFAIVVYPDRFPEIKILKPSEKDVRMPPDFILPMTFKATDDFGISRIALEYQNPESSGTDEIVSLENPDREVIVNYDWELSRMPLPEGQTIVYRLLTWDNDTLSGPKMSATPYYSIKLPTKKELYDELEEMADNVQEQVGNLLQEEQFIKEKKDELLERMRKQQIKPWEAKQEARAIAERQKKILEEATEISKSLDELIKRGRENPYMKTETLAKFLEMQSLLREALTPELADALERLNRELSKVQLDPEEMKMFSNILDEQQLEQKFDRMINLLKRINAEQKMFALRRELQEIASREVELISRTRELEAEIEKIKNESDAMKKAEQEAGLAEKSRALSLEQNSLAELLEKTLEKAKKAEEAVREENQETGKNFSQLLEKARSKKIPETMKRAGEKLSQTLPAPALAEEETARNDLNEALEELKNFEKDFLMSRKEKLVRDLEEVFYRAINLARSQLMLKDELLKLNYVSTGYAIVRAQKNFDELLGWEVEITGLAELLLEKIIKLSGQSFMVNPSLILQAREAVLASKRAQDRIDSEDVEGGIATAESTAAFFNLLAASLLESLNRARASAAQSMMEELMETMQQLAEKQRLLNEKMQAMIQGGGQIDYKFMAYEQEMIRQALEELQKRLEKESELGKRLGELAQEMRDLEAEYLRNADAERLKPKQEQIHNRMLDSIKAMRQDRQDKERQAKTAEFTGEVTLPAELPPDSPTALKPASKSREKDEIVLPGFEEQVELYFNFLSKE